MGLGLASMAVCLSLPETLKPEQRKAFTVARANPFANVLLLLRSGAGLRRMVCIDEGALSFDIFM